MNIMWWIVLYVFIGFVFTKCFVGNYETIGDMCFPIFCWPLIILILTIRSGNLPEDTDPIKFAKTAILKFFNNSF